MNTSTERLLSHLSDEPDARLRSPTPLARPCEAAKSLDWAALLTALESDFMMAIANGQVQYLPVGGDLMGRVVDE
ncbi:MAG: hypothetical protein JNJ89_19185 [Rubrivivax sp.]|nr:hypothetical protein [Rubrivivax sp.]